MQHPGYITPDGAAYPLPHSFTRNYSGGPTHPVLERLSLPNDGTIDPSLLMSGDNGVYVQHNSPPIPPYAPGDSHYQHMSPVSPGSADIWMGYDEASMSAASPTSPTVGGRVSAPSLLKCDIAVLMEDPQGCRLCHIDGILCMWL